MTSSMNQFLGGLAVCLAAILWGLDGIVLTPRLFNLEVAFVVFMVHAIPFLIMNLFLFRKYIELLHFDRDDFLTFFLIALLGGSLGTLAIVKALFLVHFDHLSVVVLLQKLQPIFAILLAGFFLHEKTTKKFIFWAGLAVLASYFLAFGFRLPNVKLESNYLYAILFSLLAAVSFGSATVFGKKILIKHNFATATFYRFGFTTLMMLVYVSTTGNFREISKITPQNIVIFFIIATTTGGGAILLYYFGLKKITATLSTICELCFPISAVIFDYCINHHSLSLIQWAAGFVMLFAIIRINLLPKTEVS